MAIATKADLVNAANGIFSPRTVPPPTSQDYSPDIAMSEARARRSEFAQSAAERVSGLLRSLAPTGNYSSFYGAGVAPVVSQNIQPSETYSKLLSGATRSFGGLSTAGKYGGFYNASDQEAAIRGTAQNILGVIPTLREQAAQRYTDVEKAYWDALGASQRKYFQANPLLPRSVRQLEEVQGGRVPGLKDYTKKLAEWYAQNTQPALDYLQTAQQLETTPISDLAQQVAVSAYGMNPDLARGKFGPDLSSDTAMKDYQFKRLYGKTFQEIEAEQRKDTELFGPKAQATQYKQALESLAGIPLTTLQSASGRTPEEMYNTINSQQTIPFKGKDENGNDISGEYHPSAILQNFLVYANSANWKKAEEWIKAAKNANNATLVDILYGITQSMAKRREAGRTGLAYGKDQP